MRPFLIAVGLLGVVAVSVAFAGGDTEATTNVDLAARVDALTKELEALKALPNEIKDLKDEIRELKLRVEVLSSRPVVAPAPLPPNVPRGAVGYEFNGATVYMIPLGTESSRTSRSSMGLKLP